MQQSEHASGAADHLRDVSTDGVGKVTHTFTAIDEEAFAVDSATGSRTDLDAIAMWSADPKDDDSCLGASSPVTGFDGDGSARGAGARRRCLGAALTRER